MASRVGFSGSWRTVVAPSTLLQKRLSLGHLLHSIRRLQLPHVPLSSTAVMERAMPTDHSEDKDAVPRPSRAKVQVYRRPRFRLTLDTVNPNVREMEYAVRGRLPLEAAAIDEDIRSGARSFPFKKVLYCNIGDCHATGQQPLSFVRQLLSACLNPALLQGNAFPQDVKERAWAILQDAKGGSLGSYTDSRGMPSIRRHVADFITRRDGCHASWDNIYLLNGASEGIKALLLLCAGQGQAGVMIPIPQYPLYTASIAELNAHPIGYNLIEERNWAVDVEELRRSICAARQHCQPRIMVVISPGNPTGQYLPVQNMREIVQFCHEEGLILFTDEVYQENVYPQDGALVPFQSFRKVVKTMGPKFNDFQLVSFNSTSKGYLGECGIRGGYMELLGMDEAVMEQLYKLFSTKLCPNTPGQVVTEAMVNRPQPGEPSYKLFEAERHEVLEALERKAKMTYEHLNDIPGVRCNPIQGSMYTFPRVDIPEEALEDAKLEDPNMPLDVYYCLTFLREKGVCVVPGSGFGQKEGTYHFRTTILPPERDLETMLISYREFHSAFRRHYGRL